MKEEIKETVKKLKLQRYVKIHGQLEDPFPVLSKADAFILPSLSEGVSRAAMEALYLGVPVLLRDVDGNSELVESAALFKTDQEMVDKMRRLAEKKNNRGHGKKCILPDKFRQPYTAQRWTDLIDCSTGPESDRSI